jgi:asparagine synthase (glutamine-hydrolysing)
MCGIAGVLEFDPQRAPDREGLDRMAAVLRHRGPDGQGILVDGPAGLVHRRLSIIDLVSGGQPMRDGDVWVVFNGELYNFPELRAELEDAGHSFSTRSDTEVLLRLFRDHGVDAFSRWNGMFACSFWDAQERTMVLVRDRLGKKPLYWRADRERLIFASEMKALAAYGGFERRVDPGALREYLTYGYFAGERTILEGVRRLLPGHYLRARNGEIETRPYWEFRFAPASPPPSEAEAEERLVAMLRNCVRRRMISDVPLGAFLSGGIDSSVVVALMAELSDRPVRTFTIGFEEAGYSEVEDARVVARHLGTDHHETVVRPSAFDILPDLVWHLDEPFGDSSSVPTYYVCKAAREGVTVALSGDGGDEVFAGYTRYLGIERSRRMAALPAWLRRGAIGPVVRALPLDTPGYNYLYALAHGSTRGRPGALGLFPYVGGRLFQGDLAEAAVARAPLEEDPAFWRHADALDPVSRHQLLDTHFYLPGDILTKVDRTSMAVSLEVRSPLLDFELVEFMASLPLSYKLRNGTTKHLLRKIAGPRLPSSVLTKRKQGFAVPKDEWFRRELRQASEEVLLDRRALGRGYFREDVLRQMLRHHRTGERDYSAWIWSLLVLEMWHQLYLDPETRRA